MIVRNQEHAQVHEGGGGDQRRELAELDRRPRASP
jgi:hypothetical protein